MPDGGVVGFSRQLTGADVFILNPRLNSRFVTPSIHDDFKKGCDQPGGENNHVRFRAVGKNSMRSALFSDKVLLTAGLSHQLNRLNADVMRQRLAHIVDG